VSQDVVVDTVPTHLPHELLHMLQRQVRPAHADCLSVHVSLGHLGLAGRHTLGSEIKFSGVHFHAGVEGTTKMEEIRGDAVGSEPPFSEVIMASKPLPHLAMWPVGSVLQSPGEKVSAT